MKYLHELRLIVINTWKSVCNTCRGNSFSRVRKQFLLSRLPRIAKFLRYHGSVYIDICLSLSLSSFLHASSTVEVFWASSGQEFTKRCRFTYPALFRTYPGIARAYSRFSPSAKSTTELHFYLS